MAQAGCKRRVSGSEGYVEPDAGGEAERESSAGKCRSVTAGGRDCCVHGV